MSTFSFAKDTAAPDTVVELLRSAYDLEETCAKWRAHCCHRDDLPGCEERIQRLRELHERWITVRDVLTTALRPSSAASGSSLRRFTIKHAADEAEVVRVLLSLADNGAPWVSEPTIELIRDRQRQGLEHATASDIGKDRQFDPVRLSAALLDCCNQADGELAQLLRRGTPPAAEDAVQQQFCTRALKRVRRIRKQLHRETPKALTLRTQLAGQVCKAPGLIPAWIPSGDACRLGMLEAFVMKARILHWRPVDETLLAAAKQERERAGGTVSGDEGRAGKGRR